MSYNVTQKGHYWKSLTVSVQLCFHSMNQSQTVYNSLVEHFRHYFLDPSTQREEVGNLFNLYTYKTIEWTLNA